jgi:Ca-activated chloride channel homolog
VTILPRSSGVTAQWPALLWGLLLVPIALAAYLLAQRRRARFAVRFTNMELLADVAARSPQWRRHLPPGLCLLAFAALLASLARPQAVTLVPREQATVILVMDVSGSMDATDVQPTRLIAAQQAATSFVRRLPGRLQVGVVSFADNAHMLIRPTVDRAAVNATIAALRAEGGTDMGDGLERALDVKRSPWPSTVTVDPESRGPHRARPGPMPDQAPLAVLLLSDGASDLSGTSPQDAAADARQLHVPVFTVALGTDQGTVRRPINGRSYSAPVPPDRTTLRWIAKTTGGRFFAAPTSGDLSHVYRELGSKIGFAKKKQEVTVIFVAVGLLLFVAGVATSLLRSGRFP